jgi:hypothetical protein
MRPSDVEQLSIPYPPGVDADTRLAQALGVYVEPALTLYREILADLDPANHGVAWWAPSWEIASDSD